MRDFYNLSKEDRKQAQTIIEYLLLLAVVASVVLVSFRVLLPRAYSIGDDYYNRVAEGIMGSPVPSPDYPPPLPDCSGVCSCEANPRGIGADCGSIPGCTPAALGVCLSNPGCRCDSITDPDFCARVNSCTWQGS